MHATLTEEPEQPYGHVVDSMVVLGVGAAAAAAKCSVRRPMVLSSTQKYHISTI